MIARFWERLDTMAHKLRLPGFLLRPICDRFDHSLGMTWSEIRRTKQQICQHMHTAGGNITLTCGQCGLPVQNVTTSSTMTRPVSD